MIFQKWDEVTDVIVVGYGLAGAIAAIEVHDAGARVTILEKSQYPGGCSILSGGMILCAQDAEDAAQYLTATQGGRVDGSVINAFARNLVDNEDHLRKLAQPYQATVRTTADSESTRTKAAGHSRLGYPFPGCDTFYSSIIASVPGFSGFPWVQKLKPAGVNLMRLAFDHIKDRAVEVILSAPTIRLVTDSSGSVVGVIARREGDSFALKARRAVILACGGFEQNQWLCQQYLQGMPFYSMAPLTHTGDGILMAQKVGAALWHMWHVHGSYGYKFDEFPLAFRTPFPGARNTNRIMPWIVVDKFGVRYMNEYQPLPQDTGYRAMEVYDPDVPGYSRIPSYVIFDEVGRKHGPIAQPLSIGGYIYEWSSDNLQEVDREWILKEETILRLGSRIREATGNECKMDPDILEATVFRWNCIVREGKDPLQRPIGTMIPLEAPPFYAAPVWPIISNTQGGPQHNAKQQIVDPYGKPIPHLYSAGELGSFWSHLYLLDGNLGECLISGRIAGRNASRDTPISLVKPCQLTKRSQPDTLT